jgi:DNA-binding MarR family transcriptional regulator
MEDVLRAYQRLQMHNAHVSAVVATTIGITPTDVRALLFIASEDGVTPKMIGEYLEVTSGAITNVVDRMVTADLVQRAPHPSDRRSVILALAPHGVETVDRIVDLYRRAFSESIPADRLPLVADTFTAIGAALVRTATHDADRRTVGT